jgi:hypothetical protein
MLASSKVPIAMEIKLTHGTLPLKHQCEDNLFDRAGLLAPSGRREEGPAVDWQGAVWREDFGCWRGECWSPQSRVASEKVVGRARFELATNGLKVRCSTG